MRRLAYILATAGLLLAGLTTVGPPAGAAEAAEECTPAVAIRVVRDVPRVYVGVDYTACQDTRIVLKTRDRDGNPGWFSRAGWEVPAGSGTRWASACQDDGLVHRYVAYASLKIGPTKVAQSPRVYWRTPATDACGPIDPPDRNLT